MSFAFIEPASMWKALYDSPLWIPILPSLTGAAMVLMVLRMRLTPAMRVFALVATALIVVDAWLNGPLSPLTGASATFASVLFVILGDARYFLAQRLAEGWRRALPRAIGLALVVPVFTQLAVRIPFPGAPPRIVFLVYECAAFALICLDHVARSRTVPGPARALFVFELVQYGLWIAADVVLLSGIEAGYALRVIPNLLYYCAFVPVCVLTLSARTRTEALQTSG